MWCADYVFFMQANDFLPVRQKKLIDFDKKLKIMIFISYKIHSKIFSKKKNLKQI